MKGVGKPMVLQSTLPEILMRSSIIGGVRFLLEVSQLTKPQLEPLTTWWRDVSLLIVTISHNRQLLVQPRLMLCR